MIDELKPCPFCGEKVYVVTKNEPSTQDVEELVIRCPICGVQSQSFITPWRYTYIRERKYTVGRDYYDYERVAKLWNKRVEVQDDSHDNI